MIADLKPYPAMRESGIAWLGNVPAHWEVQRGKALFRCIDVRSTTGDEELLTVSSDRGVVPRSSANVTMFKAESYVGYKLCWPGDLVVNSLWAWGRGLGVAKHHGIVSSAYGVYRLRERYAAYAGYIHELVRSAPFNWELQVRSKGIWTSRLQLADESFLGAPFPMPPPDEQAAIVRFLRYMDRHIRRYIASKRNLIALLNEQKSAIIDGAVTRGIDSRVRLRPSGVEWLGDVPEHWAVGSVGGLCGYISYGFTNPMPGADDGPFMLTANDIGDGNIRFESARHTTQIAFDRLLTNKSRPIRGDVLVTKDGTLGRVAVADGRLACINQSVALLRVHANQIVPEFLAALLRGPRYRDRMIYDAGGSTIKHIYVTRLSKMKVAYPPLAEQSEILTHLGRALGHVDRATASERRQIDLMGEFRTRLISDVVTGKVDVREAGPRLPEEDAEPESLDTDERAAEAGVLLAEDSEIGGVAAEDEA